jgi:hypothetical protein
MIQDQELWDGESAHLILQCLTFLESLNLLLQSGIAVFQRSKLFLVASNPLRNVRLATKVGTHTYNLQPLQFLARFDQCFMPCCEVLVAGSALGFFQKVLRSHASEFCDAVLREKSTGPRLSTRLFKNGLCCLPKVSNLNIQLGDGSVDILSNCALSVDGERCVSRPLDKLAFDNDV